MMKQKWLVVSTCNTVGLVNSINFLAKNVECEALNVIAFGRDLERNHEYARSFDKVITFPERHPSILNQADNLEMMPTVIFPAFHPDVCYVLYPDKAGRRTQHVPGPLGNYHSLIAFTAFTLGWTRKETRGLFNRAVFEKNGYLDRWDLDKGEFLKKFSASGIDASGVFAKNSRGKCFMHSFNHPKIDIIFDLVKEFLRQKGYPFYDHDIIPPDILVMDPSYPVYPAIAERYGFRGSYVFKGAPLNHVFDLDEFIGLSFDAYEKFRAFNMEVGPGFTPSFDRMRSLLLEMRQ